MYEIYKLYIKYNSKEHELNIVFHIKFMYHWLYKILLSDAISKSKFEFIDKVHSLQDRIHHEYAFFIQDKLYF